MRNLRIVLRRGFRSRALGASFAFLAVMLGLTAKLLFFRSDSKLPRLKAENAVVIDGVDGRILFAKNAFAPAFPASTAKILTALIALESTGPDEIVSVGNEIRLAPWDSSQAGLRVGDRIRLRDLVGGMLLPSGNDAAFALAVHVARRRTAQPRLPAGQAVERFVRWMNERAARVGAVHSRFMRPDGYHRPEQVTTASDLALIALEAMKHPEFRKIVGASRYDAAVGLEPEAGRARIWENRNKLLDAAGPYFYPGAIGIKTGHTVEAGYCLVSSARRNGRESIVVVLNSSEESVWTDSIALLDFSFKRRIDS